MRKLAAEGHDVTNRIRAMELAQEYGRTLYTGVFYRNPNPPPTYESQIQKLQQKLKDKAPGGEDFPGTYGVEDGGIPAG